MVSLSVIVPTDTVAQQNTPLSQTLSTAATKRVLSPEWNSQEEQLLALLAGQKALLLTQEFTTQGRPLRGFAPLKEVSVNEEVSSAIWLEALMEMSFPPSDSKLRASIGKLLLLQPAQRGEALKHLPTVESVPALAQLQALTTQVRNGIFSGTPSTLTSKYPNLTLYLLSSEGRAIPQELAEYQGVLPSIDANNSLREILASSVLADPAVSNIATIPAVQVTPVRLKTVAVLRALQLLYASSLDYQPHVGLIGGPVHRAYELTALGVPDALAIKDAFLQSPTRITRELTIAEQQLFSKSPVSYTSVIGQIKIRRDGLFGIASFITIYPQTDAQGYIGEVTYSSSKYKFRNMYDLCGPDGALTRVLSSLLRDPASPMPTPGPAPGASPTPAFSPGAFPTGGVIGSENAVLRRKVAASTYEFRFPGAPSGQGILTITVPSEGPIDLLKLAGITGVPDSDTRLLAAVMQQYPTRQFRTKLEPTSASFKELVYALQGSAVNPDLRGIPFVAARQGKISLSIDGSSISLISTPGPASYWGDRTLLTRSNAGIQWLISQRVVPGADGRLVTPSTNLSGPQRAGAPADTSLFTREPSSVALDLASRQLAALVQKVTPPISHVDFVSSFTPDELNLYNSIIQSAPAPSGTTPLQRAQLSKSINIKIARAIEAQFIRPLDTLINDLRNNAARALPELTGVALENHLNEKRAAYMKSGDVQRLFRESMDFVYANLRFPAVPYAADEDELSKYRSAQIYVEMNRGLQTSLQDAWIYRGKDLGMFTPVQRGSLNVSISLPLVKELDQLIISGKIQGYYKFGSAKFESRTRGWLRHDAITLYFANDLSTEAKAALADIATRYGRGAHELLGEKVVDGFAYTDNVPDESLPKLVEDIRKINPPIAEALKARLTRPDIGTLAISEGLYDAARECLERFKVSLNFSRESGLVVDRISGLASAEVFGLANDLGPRLVDRLAIEAYEDISRQMRMGAANVVITRESAELNKIWKETLRRIVLDDAYVVSPLEIVDPSKIPRDSVKWTEFEGFQEDYLRLQRKLMQLKGEIYSADLSRLSLIKGFLADSENKIYVTTDIEASANLREKRIRLGESLLQLDFVVHEMAAMNLPKQLHLFNLVRSSVGVDGKLPGHIEPFYRILDELISVTAEFSGRVSGADITRKVQQRYAATMDYLIALHQNNPRLFSASPETLTAPQLMLELQRALLEQTTRPLTTLVEGFRSGQLTGRQLQTGVKNFGVKVGWRGDVLGALEVMNPVVLADLVSGTSIAGFNAMAQTGDLKFRSPEAATRFSQVLTENLDRFQMVKAVNGLIESGFTKTLAANNVVGISTDVSDSFWREWRVGKIRPGFEFPITGPLDKTRLNTLRFDVYETRGNREYTVGERSWFDALTIEGNRYTGRFKLVLKLDKSGNLPPQYKLTFTADNRNIRLAGEHGLVSEVVLVRPPALARTDTFSLSQLVPYSNDEGGAFKRAAAAVERGVFAQQQLDIIAGGHIRPKAVAQALASENAVSFILSEGHRQPYTLAALNDPRIGVPRLTASSIAAVQSQVAAIQAARGVEFNPASTSSREALTSGLVQELKWPAAAQAVLKGLSDAQIRAVFSDNFASFNLAALRGDIAGMETIAKMTFDPGSSSSLVARILGGEVLRGVPRRFGISSDLDLVVRVRERVLKAPELTKTQRWALESGFKQLARSPLTNAERTNLWKFMEFIERGGKLSLPSQIFGADSSLSAREVISRAAYLNWAGGDRASWKEPTKLYQLVLEANFLASEVTDGLGQDTLKKALALTQSELGTLGERIDPSLATKVDRLNTTDLYKFLSTFNGQSARTPTTAAQLLTAWNSNVGEPPKVVPAKLWDPVIAVGDRTSNPSSTARAYVELRDAQNNLVWKGDVGREYNFENVDAFQVKIRNYHNDPLLPDLVAEQAAGATLPVNKWLDQATPGNLSAVQAKTAYADARTADAIVSATNSATTAKPGGGLVHEGLASRYGEVEVHSGVEAGRGRFTEVVMYREPAGGQTFRQRYESSIGVDLGFNPPAARFSDARSFDLRNHAPDVEMISFSARGLRGAALGANLVLDYVALDAWMFSYFQGASGPEQAQAVLQATVDQFKDPAFYAITGTQYLLSAAAASQVPWVATAGSWAAPATTTAIVSFGVTTLGMNAAWAYMQAPPDRHNFVWDTVLTPFVLANGISDATSELVFFPAMMMGSGISHDQIRSDPYMVDFLHSIDRQSPGENLAALFGITPDYNPTVEDAYNFLLAENKSKPFMFDDGSGDYVQDFAQRLLESPQSEWENRVNFAREVNAIAMGDKNRDLLKFLPLQERMGSGNGTNLPQGSVLRDHPIYINPPVKQIDLQNWKLLSLEALADRTGGPPGGAPSNAVDDAVEAIADPQHLGRGITFPVSEGESVQQYLQDWDPLYDQIPDAPEWWEEGAMPPQSPYGSDGYESDVFYDAASGAYDQSGGSPPWDSGDYGDATYQNGIDLNWLCDDPATGEKVPC